MTKRSGREPPPPLPRTGEGAGVRASFREAKVITLIPYNGPLLQHRRGPIGDATESKDETQCSRFRFTGSPWIARNAPS